MEIKEYEIRTGFENMDVASVHRFISQESYWTKGIPYETVKKSLENSFCVGIFFGNNQAGFARLVPITLHLLIWPMFTFWRITVGGDCPK